MNKPYFTLIMPTYNRGYIVWKAIQAVVQQTYPYWELIVIDDGSSDDTERVIAEFQADPRIRYYKKVNEGAASARNYGLKLANGQTITYLDSDDVIYPHFLATARSYFEKYREKIFMIPNYNRRVELYDEQFHLVDFTEVSSAQKPEITLQDFFHWNVRPCGTGIFHRASATTETEIAWNTELKLIEDWDFIMQLGNAFPDGFLHVPYVLFEYLQKYGGDGACSNATYSDWAETFQLMYNLHENDSLMIGQDWYPKKRDKYLKLQKDLEEGTAKPPAYRYFPQHFPQE